MSDTGLFGHCNSTCNTGKICSLRFLNEHFLRMVHFAKDSANFGGDIFVDQDHEGGVLWPSYPPEEP